MVLSNIPGVHALTDVTGFGLLGHLLEVARGSKLKAVLNMARIPLLPNVQQLAEQGYVTGASARNWAGYGHDVRLSSAITAVQKSLLTDPQTSGGLLVSCAPAAVDEVLTIFTQAGFADTAVIGEMVAGAAQVEVMP